MKFLQFFLFLCMAAFILGFNPFEQTSQVPRVPIAFVLKQDVIVNIKTVGELEAARSMTIASSIKGDQGKIIDLIADGIYVQPGQVLVKLDPSPFEEKIEKLKSQIKDQRAHIHLHEQTLEWEKIQAENKNRIAQLEVESSQLELDKIISGDGPQEISRLKLAMQKAWLKYDELNAYSNDLIELESQGLLNTTEVKHAQKRLLEEQEAYEIAKQQYENYVDHLLPMQVKKAETYLKRAQVSQHEISKLGEYQLSKSKDLIEQSKQLLDQYSFQFQEAKNELRQTEIVAPAPGMVVLREEYRSGQKRKPRIGDILIKNQPLIDLPDLSEMVVKTRVREVDLYKVGIGKPALIEVDAYPQLSFHGSVKSIGVLALNDIGRPSDEKYFEVRISLDQSASQLRPGMTTRITIFALEAKNVLTIPLHSVYEEQKQNYCYLCGPHNHYEKKKIDLGISNDQWVEIKSGLREGECICLLNPAHLD